MKEEIFKCPLCHISHNKPNDYSNINSYNDEKLLCSSCINKLLNKENNLVFPNDFIDYKNIKIIDEFKNERNKNEEFKYPSINKSIIEEIKQQSNNKLLIEEMKQQANNKSIINGMKQKQNISYKNIKNNSKNKKYYIKKTVKVNKLPGFQSKDIHNTLICSMHLLPLNVICIDEKQKICSQCALNKIHLNHKIITEKDFFGYVEELSKIYNNIKINENKYNNFNNSYFSVIGEIDDILLETENIINELKNKIISNINEQFNMALNFINLRRKEIFEKYQYSDYDISNLNESSLNWMKIVGGKISDHNTKNNNGKNINFNFLENDENKNIFNLINSGKQLNERYNFIKEINIIIDKLKLYKDTGIQIKQNEDVINTIVNNNKIIYIEENKELIKSLNLSPYESLFKEAAELNKDKISNNTDKNTNNGIVDINVNNDMELEKKNIKKNNYEIDNMDTLIKVGIALKENKNKKHKVYFRKVISNIDRANFTESDFYKDKSNKNIFKNQSNMYDNSDTYSKRYTVSFGKKSKKDINFTESSESTFPLLNNINKINKNITKLLRNNTTTNISIIPNNIKNKKNSESIELNNYNDNNININFNGDIFNYNTDSNFSINIPEIKKKNKIIKIKNNNDKINNILKLLTPKKNEIQTKNNNNNINVNESKKIIRCFSFNGEPKSKNKINNSKKNSSNSTSFIKNQSMNNSNNNIIFGNNNGNKNDEKSFRNFDFFAKTNDPNINNKNSKKKNNYKTLNTKELEKYVNYQLKKLKPNFNRINLKDNGMKIICSFFKKNKNKKYKEIKLQGCNINDFDFNLFTKSLIENNIIIPIINISENKLSDDCAFFIFDFFNEYGEIKNIIFTNNMLSKVMKEKIKQILLLKNNKNSQSNIQL